MAQANGETRGILAIWKDCRAGHEAEFEHWYQSEHLQERLAIPGFLLGRRFEAVAGSPRFFACYVTQSPEILGSAPYLARLNAPTPMTRRVMTEMFVDMTRALCRQAYRRGDCRGGFAVTARFNDAVADAELIAALDALPGGAGMACAELWTALASGEVAVTTEEYLRGRDRKIHACLTVETLRQADAEAVAATLRRQFPSAEIGVYRLLCEIEPPVA